MVDDFLRDHGLDVRAGILAALARFGTSWLWPAASGRHHLYAGRPALQHANPLHASDLASFRHGRYGIHLLFNLVLRLIFNPMLKATVGNIRLIAFYFLHIC